MRGDSAFYRTDGDLSQFGTMRQKTAGYDVLSGTLVRYFLRRRMLISKLTTPFWSRRAMREMLRVR